MKKKASKITAVTVLGIIVALTQLVREGRALVAEILPNEVPDTVYVVNMGKANGIVDNTPKIPARMPSDP